MAAELRRCRKPVWSSPLSSSRAVRRRGRRRLRRLPLLGLRAAGPLPRRGRGRVRATLAAPAAPHRPRPRPDVIELILRLRKELAEPGLDAGPDTIGWHLTHHHQVTRVAGHDLPDPDPRTGSVDPGAEEATRSPPTSGSTPSNPTRPGSPTSPTTGSPTDGTRRHRDPVLARRPLPLRPVGHRPPPRHRPDRADHLPPSRRPHGIPASTLTDNGMVFTTRLAGGKGGRNGFEPELRRLGVTRRTPAPTTPPPAARSNASSRP